MTALNTAKKVELNATISDLLLRMRNCVDSLERELRREERHSYALYEENCELREELAQLKGGAV